MSDYPDMMDYYEAQEDDVARLRAELAAAVARAERWRRLGAELHAVVEVMLDLNAARGTTTTTTGALAGYLLERAWAAHNAWDEAVGSEQQS